MNISLIVGSSLTLFSMSCRNFSIAISGRCCLSRRSSRLKFDLSLIDIETIELNRIRQVRKRLDL
jgi:hypothetical protein